MSTGTALFLVLAVWCVVAMHPVAADDSADNPCEQPPIPGKITRYCDGISTRYAYYKESNSCQSIRYTGCPENKNVFRTKGECESRCVH